MKGTLVVKDDLGRVRQLSVAQAKHEASALLLKGKPEASLLLLAKAVQFAPRDPDLRFLLGESELRTGGLESGISHLKKAVELDRRNADYELALGRALKRSSPSDAIPHFQHAIALGSKVPEPYIDLASLLLEARKPEEALKICEQGLSTCGEAPMLLGNQSVALYRTARYEEALRSALRQVQLEAPSAATRCNLCHITGALGRLDEAAQYAWDAISMEPNSAPAHDALATILLLAGKFRAGFEEYEWRWHSTIMKAWRREFSQPLWDGTALAGRTLFVYFEQGAGDGIQFSRYLTLLPTDGRIIVEVPRPLKQLINTLSNQLEVVEKQPPSETFDVQCPLLTLPHLFKTGPDSIPAPSNFSVGTDLCVKWQRALGTPQHNASGELKKIGLVWTGNPAHPNDSNRSIALSQVSRLFDLPARFFSFQVGSKVCEIQELGVTDRITDLSPALADYTEMAGALLQMDLLISVDTSVVHLAGSLGLPVWMMVPYAPDWRWQLDRTDSPWYPSLRLFRQKRPRDWSETIDELCEKAAEFCAADQPHDSAAAYLPGPQAQETVIFLSGQTRGATLEGIGRSLKPYCNSLGLNFVEISLLDTARLTEALNVQNFEKIKCVFSFASMGADLSLNRGDGKNLNVWQALNLPFVSIHGDSPAYFFDRHVMLNSNFISLYSFREHYELRKRLPHSNGLIADVWPAVLDVIPQESIDWKAKKDGKLIFLKNGRNPAQLRQFWASCLEKRLLDGMLTLAAMLENDLDHPGGNQIDDLATEYFGAYGFDTRNLTKLRLFFIAQLDDYLRAVKATRIAEALSDFPVEIRGNNWHHIDFAGKRATYIDECDYVKSIGLIRSSLGTIDMSPNTASHPHDRVTRAYGSHTLCLTNQQDFLSELPYKDRISFSFDKASIQDRVADVLDHREEAIEIGIEVARAYTRLHPPEQSVQKMLDCVSLVKLNNVSQRLPGSQDFFCWPPASIQ